MIKVKFGNEVFTINDDKSIDSTEKASIRILENIVDDIILDYEENTQKIPASFVADQLQGLGFEILNVVDYGFENVQKTRVY